MKEKKEDRTGGEVEKGMTERDGERTNLKVEADPNKIIQNSTLCLLL